ncbi:broad specificity phosphatase PhoE [Roseimicrobium gellanilyticum]|uniref:Broad specificity phosphatase PhoE n=1 Tax=Roseimicrobium gellanilyticum TaxID=748857 RepID=A0A366HP30_9BACT|nr:histidine phosphatase family protein [Roseimicrobium gellanilyticum]RBP45121.1 broad specificity phosphatase PhoE [Roseimicrobium gellanilyticum]
MSPVRIGLIRHFEVKHPFPTGWMTWNDLAAWREVYERTEVTPNPIDLGGIAWSRCISSDLPRAYTTAKAAFTGDILQLSELREPQLDAFRTGNLKLPYPLWKWVLRLAWMTSHSSQRNAKLSFMAKVKQVTETVLTHVQEDTLIVSHAGVMMFLRKELVKLGFAGPGFKIAENGKLYVFERRG